MLKATVKLKLKHAKELAKDSRRTGQPVEMLIAAILEDFLRGWKSDKRWIFYQQSK